MNRPFRLSLHSLGACAAALLLAFAGACAIEPATPAPVAAAAPDAAPFVRPTIFVCGDSTSNSPLPIQGWGTPIANYFDPAKAAVDNQGQGGASSRSYYTGKWKTAVQKMTAGDYLLLVFGINDGSTPNGTGDEVNAQGIHTYGWYMSTMATEAQAKGVHVYLLTVTARDIWTNPKATFKDATLVTQEDGYDPKDDKIERGTGNGRYTQWTKDIGAKLHLPVLDLTNLAADKYEKMGREKVMVYYSDHNHTFPAGADIVAQTIVSGLKAFKNSPFTALLSDKGKAVETADAKYVAENLASDKSPATEAKPTAPAPAK